MDVADKLRALERKRIFWTAAGGLGTFGYLCVLGLLTKWSKLLEMEPNNVGDFLAGAFAPLAFLWLVIGYILQALELKQNSESLMKQAEEMKNAVEQAEAQAAAATRSANFAAISNVFQLRDFIQQKLSILISEIFQVCEFDVMNRTCWNSYNSGNSDVFFQEFFNKYEQNGVMNKRMEAAVAESRVQGRVNQFIEMYDFFLSFVSDMPHGKVFADDFQLGPIGAVRTQMEEFRDLNF